MTTSDIVAIVIAIVGAAAWIPQLIKWFKRTSLELLTASTIRIGFTTFGPFVQLPVSISSQNQDVIVTNMTVRIRHQSQEERVFSWTHITEPLMHIQVPTGESVPFNRQQSVLAVKVIQEALTEKIVVFGDTRFIATMQKAINTARDHFNYLKDQGEEVKDMFHSKEFIQAERLSTENMFWREGAYSVEVKVLGKELRSPHRETFDLTLTRSEVDDLHANLALVKENLNNLIMKGDDTRPQWLFTQPTIHPTNN